MSIDHPIGFKNEMVRAIIEGRKTQTRRLVASHRNCIGVNGKSISKALWADIDWSRVEISELKNLICNEPVLTAVVFVRRSRSRLQQPGGFASLASRVKPGHRLWVRERFGVNVSPLLDAQLRSSEIVYESTWDGDGPAPKWKAGTFMRKEYARLWLKVTAVRLEYVQGISEQDCIAEGIRLPVVRSDDPDKVRPVVRLTGKYPTCNYLPKVEPPGSWTPGQIIRAEFAALWDSINGREDGAAWADNPPVWVYEWEPVRNETR